MLKLKLQYFGYLMLRANSLEKTLMLGKIEGRRRRKQQRTRWLDSISDLMDMSLNKSQDLVDREAWRAAVHGITESDMNEQLKNELASKDRRCRTVTQIFIVRNIHGPQMIVYKILVEMSVGWVIDQLSETIVFFCLFIKLCS